MRTLLLDLDGTLLASRAFPLQVEFVARTLARFGWHGGLVRAVRALKAVRAAVERPDGGATNAERACLAFAREMGMALPQATQVLQEEVTGIFAKMERHFHPVPGAAGFVSWAGSRYRLILATNPVWPLEQVHLRLSWAGIDPSVFSSITHSARMHHCKPSVDYYRELIEQEGLDPADCALVGDDFRKDLPAVQAGISVFILRAHPSRSDARRLVLPGAQASARSGSFPELMRLLDGEVT